MRWPRWRQDGEHHVALARVVLEEGSDHGQPADGRGQAVGQHDPDGAEQGQDQGSTQGPMVMPSMMGRNSARPNIWIARLSEGEKR